MDGNLMKKTNLKLLALMSVCAPAAALSQVPDLVTAFDAGGSALGMGSAGTVLGSDTYSSYYNPAGLGYATRTQVAISARNLPKSTSTAFGNLLPSGSERLSTTVDKGPMGLTHAGAVIPIPKKGGGTNGAIGIALTTGGLVRDDRVAGAGLNEGGLPAPGFSQRLENRTEFLTVSYGRSAMGGSLNWGAGLVYAMNSQTLDRVAPSGTTAFHEDATGLGFIAGVQYAPVSQPNWSFGLSYRSPIKLSAGGAPLIFSEVPGRLSAGVGWRKDGFRGRRDYLVLALQADHYFAGAQGNFFDRDPQTVLGLGAEYSYHMGSTRIPVRLGYSSIPSAGKGFGKRDSFTFGVGYRPTTEDWGVDLGFARPFEGGNDIGISMFYRFGK